MGACWGRPMDGPVAGITDGWLDGSGEGISEGSLDGTSLGAVGTSDG
jgi:hypothetical protein